MKILLLIDSLGSGGAQRQIVTLARMLKLKNYEVSVLCYAQDNFFSKSLEEASIPIHWQIEANSLKRIFKIRHFVRNGRYDVVISFLDVPNFLNCFAAIGGKKWKVITCERSAKDKVFVSRQGAIFGWFQRYADALICNSNNAKNMWIKYFPQYQSKLGVIYNPVILPKVRSSYILKKNGKLHLIIAASYQYLKNPIGLIHALTLLNEEEKKKIKIIWYGRLEIISGNRKAYDEASDLIKQHKLEEILHLNEPTKDIANRMHEADVVALFSELEGLPNAICEGMMLGKPIIMSRVSDYDKLVDDSNGFLCDWDNPKSIKEALVSATNLGENKLVEMGRKSRLKADKYFSEDIIITQWLKLIK